MGVETPPFLMTYFKKGEWNADCMRCGFQYKSGSLKKDWEGLYVCKECWEPRHPQEFLKGRKDHSSVPWTNKDDTDTEVDNFDWLGRTDVPSGTNDNGL